MDPFRSLVQRVAAPASERRTSLAPRPHFPDPPSIPSHRLKTGPARQDAAASRHRDAPSNARTSTLDHLVGLVGNASTALLIATFGGTRVYIPQEPSITDALSLLIGPDALRALADIYGGDRIEIPNPPPRRVRILELRASGLSIDVIARTLHCTRRRVFQVMAEARAVSATPPPAGLKTRTAPHPPARSRP